MSVDRAVSLSYGYGKRLRQVAVGAARSSGSFTRFSTEVVARGGSIARSGGLTVGTFNDDKRRNDSADTFLPSHERTKKRLTRRTGRRYANNNTPLISFVPERFRGDKITARVVTELAAQGYRM
jgi:hypothetical protein